MRSIARGSRAVLLALAACAMFAISFSRAWPQEKPPAPANNTHDYNGMYSFLREGEFVQVTVEDGGRVTGFVSRYGDLESDKGAFLDQFFKTAKLDGEKLTFTTEVVHGTMFDFAGTIGRGTGKSQQEEAYYVIQGKLIETSTDREGKAASKERQVAFKSFPRSASSPPPPRQ
jgi:hypothetical protein